MDPATAQFCMQQISAVPGLVSVISPVNLVGAPDRMRQLISANVGEGAMPSE